MRLPHLQGIKWRILVIFVKLEGAKMVSKVKIIQDTKENIINIARRLFSECTYLGVSMNDIAKRLNITKAALYYHFKGKAEIYKKVLERVFDELNEEVLRAASQAQNPKERLRQAILSYLKYGQREKILVRSLLSYIPKIDPKLKKEVVKLRNKVGVSIQQIFEEASPEKNTKSLALLTTMMNGLLLEQLLSDKIDAEGIVDELLAVLKTGG